MYNNKKKTVVIALSGGVDSTVAAKMLISRGYNVIAVFMQNWDDYINNHTDTNCGYLNEWKSAIESAKQLKIKIHRTYFIKEYWDNVFLSFIKDIELGKTPNPDILCNKMIKFKCFVDYVLKTFKPDFIATGHYAGIIKQDSKYYLIKSKDEIKDQTYFLCQIDKTVLNKIIFPLSNFTKKEVRTIAKKEKFANAEKKDSTGICFIGTKESNFSEFISKYIPKKEGKIVHIHTKEELGIHDGLHLFTIGQRRGMNIKTKNNNAKAHFVVSKNKNNNTLFVTDNYNDELLYSYNCEVSDFNWLIDDDEQQKIFNSGDILTAKLRSQQKEIKIKNVQKKNDLTDIYVEFLEKQKSVTPGQYIVLYDMEICVGGGVVNKTDRVNESGELIKH